MSCNNNHHLIKELSVYLDTPCHINHSSSNSEPSADNMHIHVEVNTPHAMVERPCEVVGKAPPQSHAVPLINPMVPSEAEYTSEHVPQTAQAPTSSVPYPMGSDNIHKHWDDIDFLILKVHFKTVFELDSRAAVCQTFA